MNKENEPLERPKSAHHSRRVIKYSTTSGLATGPVATDVHNAGRDHREQTSRRLTQAAKQRKMSHNKTHFPPITRDSVEDFVSVTSHENEQSNSRSRPRTAKARLENGRSLSASGPRTSQNTSVHFSDIHARPLSRSASAGRQRRQEDNSQLQFKFTSHDAHLQNKPVQQDVIELSGVNNQPQEGTHLVTTKSDPKHLYQNAQLERSLVDVNIVPPSDDNKSVKSSSSKNSFMKDEVYPKPRSPQLRRSMKVIANNSLKDRLDIKFLPRPPSAKSKGRRSTSASSERPSINHNASPRPKMSPRKVIEQYDVSEADHVNTTVSAKNARNEYLTHNGYAHSNGDVPENNHESSGYNSNDSRRNNSDDSPTAYSPRRVAHLPPKSDGKQVKDEPRDLVSFLQQNERRLHTEFDFRGEDTLRQRPKSDTVLGSRSKSNLSRNLQVPGGVRSPAEENTAQRVRSPPNKAATPRASRSPPNGYVHTDHNMPSASRRKRNRPRTAKMKIENIENDSFQYAPVSHALYTETDTDYNETNYRERPWGRGRYTGQHAHPQQHSNAFKYGESTSLPIAELVESDCDTRPPGVVENYDLRDIYTDDETEGLGDSFSKSNTSSKYSLKKQKSILSLDSEDNKLIQDRWERAAMLEGLRSTVKRGEGHVCVCRVCAEILLLPDDSFYEAIDRGSEVDTSAQAGDMTQEEKERQQEEWRRELIKLEDEIHTLQSVLHTKVRVASELKRKLGITPMTEFKDDLRSGIKSITDSDAYQKTNETLSSLNDSIQKSDAYQKTSDAFKSFGAWSSKKLGDARNSTVFKSVEEKVGGAYTNVKSRVTGSKSDNNFQELKESDQGPGQEPNGSAPTSTVSTPGTDTSTPQQQLPM